MRTMNTRPPMMAMRSAIQIMITQPESDTSSAAPVKNSNSAVAGSSLRSVERNGCQSRKKPKCVTSKARASMP